MGMDRTIEKKRWTPRRIAWIGGASLFFLLLVYLVASSTGGSTLRVEPDRLTIADVKKGPFQEFIPVIGQVLPLKVNYLDAVEGGRVEEIYIRDGKMVTEGDRILRLSNTNLLLDIMYREAELFQQSNALRSTRLQLEQNRLSLNRDVNEVDYLLEKAKLKYDRNKTLHDEGILSAQDLDDSKKEHEFLIRRKELTLESQKQDLSFREQQVAQLESSLERMQKNLDVVKEKLENLTIRAPVSGHLTALNAEIGQVKSPGERLGQIDEMTGFKVRAQIDEHYIDRIEQGKVGQFDFSGSSYKLVAQVVYPEVRDGKFEVDLAFAEKEPDGIRRGQSLHIRLELSDIYEALLVPRGGFFQKTGGNWIFVLNDDGKVAEKREIKLGRQNPEYFEVLSGLKPGEKVVTSSYDSFGDMDRLVLK